MLQRSDRRSHDARVSPPRPRAARRAPAIDRRTSARAALARIARAQLDALAANEEGVRSGEDAERLHDARVALRRLRSLFSEMKGVLARRERGALVAELHWIAGRLGPARDLDTLLAELRSSETDTRDGLAPAIAHLERVRAVRQAELRSTLDSERYRAALARLRRVTAAGARPAGKRAARPFARVLGRRLRKRFEQVAARARRSSERAPGGELHRLRIACKKLRWLLECCRGLAPRRASSERALSECRALLEELNDALGTLHDAEVHTEAVAELEGARFAARGRAQLALRRFREEVLRRGRRARADQARLVEELLARKSRRRFRTLVRGLERS